MKSRYFPKTDIFQATTKARDSWLWKSWNEAKNLIREGCKWKVGIGVNMRVWEDKGFNEDQWEKLFTPKPENCPIQKVSELINQSRRGWNVDLISEMFLEE